MKRVLLLAYLFPPIANSGTSAHEVRKVPVAYGWEPTVITAERFDDHHDRSQPVTGNGGRSAHHPRADADHHITDRIVKDDARLCIRQKADERTYLAAENQF